MIRALIFDVDGTLAETEEAHLMAFNAAFDELGLGWHWDEALNHELLAIAGGFERLRFFQARLPEGARLDDAGLAALHAVKKRHYERLLAEGALELRPGVRALIDAAREAGLRCAVVTASSNASFGALVRGCFRQPVAELFDVVVTGGDVSRKKPDPQGYLLALEKLGLSAAEALAFEDSPVGHAAARAAGLEVVVTPSRHGPQDDDYGTSPVLPSLAPEFWSHFGFSPAQKDAGQP